MDGLRIMALSCDAPRFPALNLKYASGEVNVGSKIHSPTSPYLIYARGTQRFFYKELNRRRDQLREKKRENSNGRRVGPSRAYGETSEC